MVSGQVIARDRLGALTRIGQGGQGVVYTASKVRTTFAAFMAYKEYKPAVLGGIEFGALAQMPALVEETLSYAQAKRLISIAAWPCAIVEDHGTPTGFVMPVIPEAFFIELSTVKGTSATTAEFQHLLNHPCVLAARGIVIDDAQRYRLLRETASTLAFLHAHGVCVGDISPKNLLFSLTPREAVYVIDCDAVRIHGVSALTQVETPGWGVPAGEELATIYSDAYKLGLLAVRLLAGEQDTTNPGHLPTTTPAVLRQLITDTLTNPPHRRPLPDAWTHILGHVIEEVPASIAPPYPARSPAPPEMPIVHSRRSAGTPPAPPPQSPDSSIAAARLEPHSRAPADASAHLRPRTFSAGQRLILLAGGVAIVAAIAIAAELMVSNARAGRQEATFTSTVTTVTGPASSTPAAATAPDVRVYDLSTDAGLAEQVAAQLRDARWNVTETGNLTLAGVTTTTVYFGSAPAEKEAAVEIGTLLQAPVEPRTPELADQPPGVIVVAIE